MLFKESQYPDTVHYEFMEAGLNINDPKYGRFLEPHEHLSKSRKYNEAWETFFESHGTPSADEILKQKEVLMDLIYGPK